MSENSEDLVGAYNARPRVQVLKPVERRRRWTAEEKQSILQEAEQPRQSISAVGRKYSVSACKIYLI